MDSSGEAGATKGKKISREVTVRNKLGLHARPASEFAQTAQQFESEITVSKAGHASDGKSVIGLLMLAAGEGTTLNITAHGADAEEAMTALTALIDNQFEKE